MADISQRADIEQIVNTFYQKVRNDAQLGPIFDEIAQVNWNKHLPKMYDFWEHVLWGTGSYNGHPMLPHFQVNDKFPLLTQHFNHWKALFFETVDELFVGEQADRMKASATSIASIMESKMKMAQLFKVQHHSNPTYSAPAEE
ncbi:MAG: group III truncated hemoglobin [Spirosomataceae bacterium]